MSKRPRKKAMRRAYLKKNTAKFETNPDRVLANTIGIGRQFNPTKKEPVRKVTDYSFINGKTGETVHRLTSVETVPISNKRNIKVQKTEWNYILIRTPLRRVTLFFSGFGTNESYWFKWFDPICETERVSITYGSKVIAMSHFTKGTITWKQVNDDKDIS